MVATWINSSAFIQHSIRCFCLCLVSLVFLPLLQSGVSREDILSVCQDGCGSRWVDQVSEVEAGEIFPYTTRPAPHTSLHLTEYVILGKTAMYSPRPYTKNPRKLQSSWVVWSAVVWLVSAFQAQNRKGRWGVLSGEQVRISHYQHLTIIMCVCGSSVTTNTSLSLCVFPSMCNVHL